MPTPWSRRRFLALTAGVTLATACGTDEPGTVADDGSVTVAHVFGETRIPAPPQRVVSAGFTEQDDLLAVGVVPIAVTEWFGGEPFAVWPWAQAKLGGAQPTVLSLADGIQVDQIAALRPDLIVAVNAGLDQDTYTRLSGIVPTIAQSGQAAFFEAWKEQATTVGQAVFKSAEMTALISAVDDRFVTTGTNNPQFAGKRVLLMSGTFYQDSAVATRAGWRTDFLTQMGFVIPDSIDNFARDDHRAVIPRDQMLPVLDSADVLIWTTESEEEQAGLLADPTIAKLGARVQQRSIFTGKELAGAIAFASPLSYPVVADQLPPGIARALA